MICVVLESILGLCTRLKYPRQFRFDRFIYNDKYSIAHDPHYLLAKIHKDLFSHSLVKKKQIDRLTERINRINNNIIQYNGIM